MKKRQNTRAVASQKKFPLRFRNQELLEAALFHPSYRNENSPRPGLQNFDRLEFFGDSVLNYVICRKIFKIFPDADEGMLSRLRSILVSRRILSRISKELRFTKFIRLGKSLQNQPEFLKLKVFADTFEALIAAYYFDQGFEKTERFILKCFRGYFDAKKLLRLDPNPKSTLQELSQKYWQKLPLYTSENAGGSIKTTVSLGRAKQASASGRTRQESEEKAARILLRSLRQDLLGRLKRKSSGRKLRKTS
jgi:ribonuclease III